MIRLSNVPIGEEVCLMEGPYEGGVFLVRGRLKIGGTVIATRLTEPGGKELEVGCYSLGGDTSCMIVDNEEK